MFYNVAKLDYFETVLLGCFATLQNIIITQFPNHYVTNKQVTIDIITGVIVCGSPAVNYNHKKSPTIKLQSPAFSVLSLKITVSTLPVSPQPYQYH